MMDRDGPANGPRQAPVAARLSHPHRPTQHGVDHGDVAAGEGLASGTVRYHHRNANGQPGHLAPRLAVYHHVGNALKRYPALPSVPFVV